MSAVHDDAPPPEPPPSVSWEGFPEAVASIPDGWFLDSVRYERQYAGDWPGDEWNVTLKRPDGPSIECSCCGVERRQYGRTETSFGPSPAKVIVMLVRRIEKQP